jgi:hypothetical protein
VSPTSSDARWGDRDAEATAESKEVVGDGESKQFLQVRPLRHGSNDGVGIVEA